jgi:uridine phosphorylase
MHYYKDSELIVQGDGSIYHLNLKPHQIAQHIILVGDPGRVAHVSGHFSRIEHKVQNREFHTHTGYYRDVRISVVSTGIGTDNIDIVVNELDALVNIDLEKRTDKDIHTPLNLIRLGTSGALQPDVHVDTFVASAYGLGFDGLMNYYGFDHSLLEEAMSEAYIRHTGWNERLPYPYIVAASGELINILAYDMLQGITATANGFYGPQGRELRIPLAFPELNERIESFSHQGKRITNFEMETSGLYGLGKLLGHQTLTICAIIANRVLKTYSADYQKTIDSLIELTLQRIVNMTKK